VAEYALSQPGAIAVAGTKASTKGALPKGTVCSGLEIVPSENGGFTVTHRYSAPATKGEPYPYVPSRDYTFESVPSMLDHVRSVFGGGGEAAGTTTGNGKGV
jgi:hypothetical protein